MRLFITTNGLFKVPVYGNMVWDNVVIQIFLRGSEGTS